ncbi:MAG: amidohydrolase family protein [Acidobacteriota bacterium]
MRIDAHQHFWNYDATEYAWISDAMPALKCDRLPADLKPLLDQAGFDGCIAVQARQSLEETRFLLDVAHQHGFVCGVVGWVDLCSPEVERQIEAFAADPKLVGIRHIVQDEPDDRFLLREDFRRGIAALARFDLAYDVLIYPRQLAAAIEFVPLFPQQRFVLDHIAKPLIAEGKLEPWATDIRKLARNPNLYCKLSGMVTEAAWKQWRTEDFHPYLDVVVESFGPERLMIGSDWPVCALAGGYADTIRIVTDYISRLSAAEQDAILGGNCERFYRLSR